MLWRVKWRLFKRKRRKLEYEQFRAHALEWHQTLVDNRILGVWDK